MRVVYLNPVAGLGGAERCLLDLMASVREAHPEVDLHLVVATEGPLLEEARRLGVGVTLLPMPEEMMVLGDSGLCDAGRLASAIGVARSSAAAALSVRRYAVELGREVRALRPSVVHSNGIKFHLMSAMTRFGGSPVLWHIRDLLGSRPLMARALGLAARRATAAIAISEIVSRDARAVLGSLPIDVIYDAIDTDYFSPAEGDGAWLDALAGLPPASEDAVRVGLVATYGRWKGQDLFLEAVARIVVAGVAPAARFYVVGGPIYQTSGSQFSERELRERAAALGIENHVGFVGFQRDVAEVFRALDVVVHASTRPEPFGRTIAEAMACARPLVLAEVSGAAELFGEEPPALTVPNGDVAALSEAISRLITDGTLRGELSEKARRIAVDRFSRRRIGRQIMDVYTTYANSRGAVSAVEIKI